MRFPCWVATTDDTPDIDTRMLLVRHGESNATVGRLLAGELADTGLSELGIRQSEALRDRLSAEGMRVDGVVASTLPRALETAEIVAPTIGVTEIQTDAELVERRPGEADGLTFSEYLDKYGDGIWTDPYLPLAPGGESASGFHRRAGAALSRVLLEYSGRTVMVFCHGGVIDVAFREFLDVSRYGGFDLWTLNTSLTELLHTTDGGAQRRTLVRYNDAAHLAGLPRKTVAS